ncbi:integrase, catalytic region, zinc finger, CCHC-type containing protein [Tanacetum coccineum]
MSKNKDKYHDTILDLEENLKKNVDMFLKIGNSLQAMFMLGPKPLSVYDQQLKHGLGYPNPYTLRQGITEMPKVICWHLGRGCPDRSMGCLTVVDQSILRVTFTIEETLLKRLGHNLFSVGQFCDGDLEVTFCSKICYVRNLEGDDLLTGGRDSNLYTISISDMVASSPICLMSKATSTKSWLWHRRLSHLNFGTINGLTKLDLVDGLPKFKYEKDHLCSACERGKSKKASHPPKLIPSDYSKLELLHIDLCGPMRVALVNGKKYLLVIVDDFSRFTWVYFLHSKEGTAEIIKKFIAQAQLNYKAKVCKIRTDNGTEFKNATLKAHYEKLGIMQQFSIARTP